MSAPDFSKMDPAQAAAAQAELEAQMKAIENFNIEAFTLLGIALVVTGLRTYSRITAVGIRKFQADDYLVLVGATFHAIETALAYCVGMVAHGLANNSMTPEQRESLVPGSPEYDLRVIGSKIQLCGWTSYSILLWSLKAAMCTFYLRLTDGLEGYRKRIYFGFFFIGASWLTVILNLFLSCRPFNHMWQVFPDPGIYCQPAISPALVWVFLSFNIATDLYLISIPMPMLFKASMPLKKKLALIGLFSCGLFVVMAATLRVALLVMDPVNGALLAGSWAVRETFVAVVTTNLPMLFPLFRRWLSPFIGTIGSTLGFNSKKSGNSSKVPTLETFGQGGRRNRKPGTVNPITNVTYSESEERIVEEMRMGELNPNKPGTSARSELSGRSESDSERGTRGAAGSGMPSAGLGSGFEFNFNHARNSQLPGGPNSGDVEKGPPSPSPMEISRLSSATTTSSNQKSVKGQRSGDSMQSPTLSERRPGSRSRNAGGPGPGSLGIQKEVSVHVEETRRRDLQDEADLVKGNYTSTWPSKASLETPRRTEYFVDHVHQNGYRNAS